MANNGTNDLQYSYAKGETHDLEEEVVNTNLWHHQRGHHLKMIAGEKKI